MEIVVVEEEELRGEGFLRGKQGLFQRELTAIVAGQERLNPIKLAYNPSLPAPLKGLGQYASSPGDKAYCFAELAVSSLAVVTTYPQWDG